MICCDILISSANTYVNQSLGHASSVDHVFLSPDLYNTVNSAKVIDCAHNASDHRPVAIVLDEIVVSFQFIDAEVTVARNCTNFVGIKPILTSIMPLHMNVLLICPLCLRQSKP